MLWQDYVFTGGATILTLALVPTLLDKKEKPAFFTSLMSGTVLLVFGVVYYSLSLRLSAFIIEVNAVLWFILALQKLHERKISSKRKGVYTR